MKDTYLYDIFTTIISFFVLVTLAKNYLFLLISPLYPVFENRRYLRALIKIRKKKLKVKRDLKFSIIIPAWNEEVGLVKTLQSILDNNYKNIQIIVVNDGSTDNTELVYKDFKKKLQKKDYGLARKIKYIYQENKGKGGALNTGVEQAKGDIVLTMDADSALRKDALRNLAKYYLDDKIMAVVGNVQVTNTKTLIGLAQHLEYYTGFYNKRAHAVLGAEYIFGGACASFRRSIFKELGGFDTKNKTEDIEMSMRIRAAGYNCTYAEDVVCYTEGASDINGLISQRVRWKKGRLDTFRKYKHLFFSTDSKHNFFLSFFVLPFSVLSEIQLIFEPIAIGILVSYSLITLEFLSISIGIAYILIAYLVVALFSNDRTRLDLILLFPFTWPLFFLLDWIEFLALFKSIKLIMQKEDVVWQNWKRVGI